MSAALRLIRPEAPSVPDYRALRRAVRHNTDLSHHARHVFEDVCELSERDGFCQAGDKHFAEVYGVERRTVRRWIDELKTAGYIRAEGATRSRRLIPANPETGDALRTPTVLSGAEPRTPAVLNGPDLGHPQVADLGHPQVDTKSINTPPEGERGARAHEGFDPVDAFRSAYPGYSPNTHQLVLLQSMTDEAAFGAALRYWLENDHKPQSVGKLRDRYQRIERGEAGADGKIAARPGMGAPSLDGDLTPEQRDWLVANTPGLTAEDFWIPMKDTRTNLPIYRVRPDAKARLQP